MSAPSGKLTDLPEIAGIAWAYAVNPLIFRSLVAQGYRDHLVLAALALGIAVSVIVLVIFLLLRKAMAGTGAPPPPADRPTASPKFTDLRELAAYVLAHAAGMAWGFIVNPLIFRSLIAQGVRYLMPIGLALSIAVSIVVLLLFLFLRKAMAGSDQPT